MRKSCLLVLLLFTLSLTPVKGDEGMWLLPLIEKLNNKKLSELGFTLTAKDIYNINHSGLKDAIVHFGGGCTAEIVSNSGLLFTNHHCGYGAIQRLSSVENNYLKDGFWAMNLSEELPAQGLTVTFLESFTDVTKDVEKALSKYNTQEAKDSVLKVLSEEMTKKVVEGNKYLSANLQSFYGGNSYYLIVSKVFRDVRFVGAPPSSIGKFGADTDNWMWPRHTGDFSVFRVYADKDNNPAPYSADNVPYTPKQFLKVSLKGVKPNDPAMIIGYPGRTNRFMTRSELVETRDVINAISIYVRGVRQGILMEDMQADPKIMIQYASKYSGSSNGWKKWIGMNETFAKLDVEKRRADEEVKFMNWVNKNKKRTELYGDALNKVNTAIESRRDALKIYQYTSESIGRIEISSAALTMAPLINEYASLPEAQKEGKLAIINAYIERFYKDYSSSTDRKVAKAMLKIYKENVPASNLHPVFFTIEENFGGDINMFVDFLFDNSLFASREKLEGYVASLKAAGEDSSKGRSIMEDPAVMMDPNKAISKEISQTVQNSQKQLSLGKKEYIAGTLEMRKGEAIYPDANSTMRMTYGSVLPYSPRDGVLYDYYTTLDGVMEKEDPNNWEFVVPERLKELWKNKDFGEYGLPNGKMPVCFLSNNDITGGNSGSPVLNGAGELIGLAFDGNWESMSGDIIFEPQLQRCINVDIRYVLFIIDKYGGAGYLLKEMDIVR